MKKAILIGVLILFNVGAIFAVLKIFTKKEDILRNKVLCKNCNVVLVQLDTLAAKHLPCYGYDRNTAPNLCKYAKDNIYFTKSYSQAHWTLPSTFSIFTGLHMTTHKVVTGFKDTLSPKYKTITEILKTNGYDTLFFGPTLDFTIPLDKGMERGFNYIEKVYDQKNIDAWYRGIDKIVENQKTGKPTFLYLHTYIPHEPYLAGIKSKYQFVDNSKPHPNIPLTDKEYNKYDEKFIQFVIEDLEARIKSVSTPTSIRVDLDMLSYIKGDHSIEEKKRMIQSQDDYFLRHEWYQKLIDNNNPNDVNYLNSIYDESIYNMDQNLGQFFNYIKAKGLDKNTIFVFTADHGEEFMEHGSFAHCWNSDICLYNETIQVPLIISIPGIKSEKIDSLAQGIDIMPTILSLVGVNQPNYLEGTDLSGQIKKMFDPPKNEYIISEEDFGARGEIITDGEWKLYVKDFNKISEGNQISLYNIKDDKGEKNDLINKNQDEATKLLSLMMNFVQRKIASDSGQKKGDFPDWIDSVRRERLIKNGYF